ncbi:MAG: hypothetical protein KKC39_01970 [Candidatus Omnitrophica bacterium]|nr:hypothetical protein [Candidatus Omnitrophota bacterium]MBU4467500.1 hypothetical protein [Candidatus Omnitrophota bacterium]
MMTMQIKKYGSAKASAQSTLEYAMVVACVVAALLGMQFYLRRGVQGKLRQAGDELGEQYTPLNVESKIITETTSTTGIIQSLVPLDKDGKPLLDQYGLPVYGMKTEASIDETTQKSGKETLGEFEDGLF